MLTAFEARRARNRPGARASVADLRRDRRRPDRRRARRHARRDRAPHAARRIPPHRPAQRARPAGRSRAARAVDVPGIALATRRARQLERLGVEVRTGGAVTRDRRGRRRARRRAHRGAHRALGRGRRGVAARRASLGVPLDRAGRVPVAAGPHRARAIREIFVVGDLATVTQDGKPVPGVAPAAKQMGRHVAGAIRARLAGRPAPAVPLPRLRQPRHDRPHAPRSVDLRQAAAVRRCSPGGSGWSRTSSS